MTAEEIAHPETQKLNWEVDLDSFQGPLDLLLHLIDTYEIDIYDIPIAEITDQYLRYVKAMQSLELDVAGEYLVMAATLLQMKSESLIPSNEAHSKESADGETFEENSRQELTAMLLEYKKYKEIVPEFEKRQAQRSSHLTKETSDLTDLQINIPLRKDALEIEDLGKAMQQVIERYELLRPQATTIEAEEKTVDEQVEYIAQHIQSAANGRSSFTQLLKRGTKSEIVVTFLAILELMKNHLVRAYQKHIGDDIILQWQTSREEFEESDE